MVLIGKSDRVLDKYKGVDTEVRDYKKYERSRWLFRQYERYKEYWKPELERATRNARMYWSVNFGQWPSYVVERLREQGRRPPTYPVIPDKIESLIGSFLANGFDMKYEPIDGQYSKLCLAIQDMYFSDKAAMDWESSEIQCLLNAHIMVGYERMVVSDCVDDFGNLAFESLNPLHVLKSPQWQSDFTRDLTDYFIWNYMTAEEIMNNPAYKHKSEILKQQYEKEKISGKDYGRFAGGTPEYATIRDKWQSQHEVIEFHYVKEVNRKYEYDLKNHCFFPETGFKMGSDEDRAVKMKYIQDLGLDQTQVTWLPQKKRIKYMEAIAPSLDRELFLASGKDMIQTNNVNLYPLSIRFRGQDQGIVDRLYDIQQSINVGEMTEEDILQRSAKGAFFIDRALSGGDPELEQKIEQAWNDPGARIWVDEDSTRNLPGGGVVELPGTYLGADRTNWLARKYDASDRFSKVPAAQDSRTESSQESGRLFRYKLEVGQVGQKFLLKFYERHVRDKAEAYMLQAKITYAGYPRIFTSRDGKRQIEINTRVKDRVTGEQFVVDDISMLPRMKVTLVPSKKGVNLRNQLKTELVDMLQLLVNPQDALMRSIVVGNLIMTADLSDDVRERMEKATSMAEMENAMAQGLRISQLKQQLQYKAKEQTQTPVQAPQRIASIEYGNVEEKATEGTPIGQSLTPAKEL